MQKTCDLLARGFESSTGKTPEFLAFARTFKKEFKTWLASRGGHDFDFHVNHFEISGFFRTRDGQAWYFATGDMCGSAQHFGLLYRTAKDYKDYTGGRNRYVRYSPNMVNEMDLTP